MILSVIIVSYNVRYFLEQCLCSVSRAVDLPGSATSREGTEIIVIDNHSSDGSMTYLRELFPSVRFVSNTENAGFARACNQGLALARGRYILFLNPDTILAEDTLEKSLAFLGSHPETGALGVRMIDGRGQYLPESMRGFPSPWVAFCKLSGLAALLPHSRYFAGYYLGHLSPAETNRTDAVSGAFMLVPREVLEKTGGFDERFFMYGEDIDLSYRIVQGGYHNVYFAKTTIIHFKGESTRKDAGYVRQFYKAMSQFISKHYGKRSRGFLFFLDAGIWIRSRIGLAAHFIFPERKKSRDHDKILTRLAGDECSAMELRKIFPLPERILAEDPSQAAEIVYCEGPGFPFSSIIEVFQHHRGTVGCRVHAGNSRSLVGSDSKNFWGDTAAW